MSIVKLTEHTYVETLGNKIYYTDMDTDETITFPIEVKDHVGYIISPFTGKIYTTHSEDEDLQMVIKIISNRDGKSVLPHWNTFVDYVSYYGIKEYNKVPEDVLIKFENRGYSKNLL